MPLHIADGLGDAVENLFQRRRESRLLGANDSQRHDVRLGHVRLQRQAQDAGDASAIVAAARDHLVRRIATRGS